MVNTPDCGSGTHGFDSHIPPQYVNKVLFYKAFFSAFNFKYPKLLTWFYRLIKVPQMIKYLKFKKLKIITHKYVKICIFTSQTMEVIK